MGLRSCLTDPLRVVVWIVGMSHDLNYGGSVMVGVITGWDVLAHPLVTIHGFGWRVFFLAVAPWQAKTFLSLLQPIVFPEAATSKASDVLERCIRLELRAKRIYETFARLFDEGRLAGTFFAHLAIQEQDHADLLEVCKTFAARGHWKGSVFNPWEVYLPRLEEQMDAAEDAARMIGSVDAALQLAVQIELSEVNTVFRAAVAATDAAFVKKLAPFREAVDLHIAYIVERLPELSPSLAVATRELRARFPGVRR
jgi:hypothetical protein